MHSTSALYNEILAGEGGYNVECKVEINGSIYGMNSLVSVKTSQAAFGNGTLDIGLAPCFLASYKSYWINFSKFFI